MRVFENTYSFQYPWQSVTLAVWMKYPNPFSHHVIHCDVLSRRVDPTTGKLYTTRLFNKTSSVPHWGKIIFKSAPTALIVEESVVDPKAGVMTTRTRNVSHQRYLKVEETQTMTRHPTNPSWTQVHIEARVISNFGFGLQSRIETMGLGRFREHVGRSRRGMHHILERLGEKGARWLSSSPTSTPPPAPAKAPDPGS